MCESRRDSPTVARPRSGVPVQPFVQCIEVSWWACGHHEHVFHSDATVDATIETWLDGEDFSLKDFAPAVIEQDRLVHIQPDAMSGSVLDAGMVGDLASRDGESLDRATFVRPLCESSRRSLPAVSKAVAAALASTTAACIALTVSEGSP